MKPVYVDTSILLSILLETEKSDLAEKLLDEFKNIQFIISGIAINETLYIATYEYYKQRSLVKGKYSLRKVISKKNYPAEVLNTISSLLRDLDIVVISDYFDYDEYLYIMREFKLLPNDAQIVLTCKHYGIDTILTFDEDFKRIPWLRVIP